MGVPPPSRVNYHNLKELYWRITEPTRDTLLRADKHLKNPYSVHNIGGVRTLLGSASAILKAIDRRITQPIRNTLFNNLSTSKTPNLFCSTYKTIQPNYMWGLHPLLRSRVVKRNIYFIILIYILWYTGLGKNLFNMKQWFFWGGSTYNFFANVNVRRIRTRMG